MSSFDMIPHLLADLLEEQKRTNDAIAALAKSLAIAVDAQRYREQKAIVAEPPVPALVEEPLEAEPAQDFDALRREASIAVKALARSKDWKVVDELFATFNVANLPEVPLERLPEVLKRFREAQAA